MTLYVNQIYFGHGRYGVEEAARFYFGKDVAQLNVGEAAVLAGLPKEPEKLATRSKEEPAAREGAPDLRAEPARRGSASSRGRGAEVDRRADPDRRRIRSRSWAPRPSGSTSCSEELVATKAARQAIDTLGGDGPHDARSEPAGDRAEGAAGRAARGRRAPEDRPPAAHAQARQGRRRDRASSRSGCRAAGPKAKEIYEAVVTAVHDDDNELVVDLGKWQAALVLGRPRTRGSIRPTTRARSRSRASGSSPATWSRSLAPACRSRRRRRRRGAEATAKHAKHRVAFAPGPEGAVVIIEVKTRKVRALVGGYASKVAGFNRATMAKRQPGSSFKPFVYARGDRQPASTRRRRWSTTRPRCSTCGSRRTTRAASSRARCCCATRSRSRSTRSRSASTYDLKPETRSRRSRTRWASTASCRRSCRSRSARARSRRSR